jgi:uncharacterized protein
MKKCNNEKALCYLSMYLPTTENPVKLHLADTAGLNLFTGYGDGYVEINQRRFETSLIVLPGGLFEDWSVAGFETLAAAHFERLAGLAPEIVLLGTGAKLRFPAPALTRSLMAARIGLEVMDTQAACRTYNILASEGRKVAAAVLL